MPQPPPKLSDFLDLDWDDTAMPDFLNWGGSAAHNLKVKFKYPPFYGGGDNTCCKRMLLQHMDTNLSTIKQIPNSHFEKIEQFMTNTMTILEKMVDNIDNVLNKVLILEQQHTSSPDE